MISPERLRRYPYFAGIPEAKLKELAMISDDRAFKADDRLMREGHDVSHLIILESGQVDIAYELEAGGEVVVDTLVGGDLLGLSALVDPYEATATAIAKEGGELIEIDAEKLAEACEADPDLGYKLLTQVMKALRGRLTAIRIQLAGQG